MDIATMVSKTTNFDQSSTNGSAIKRHLKDKWLVFEFTAFQAFIAVWHLLLPPGAW